MRRCSASDYIDKSDYFKVQQELILEREAKKNMKKYLVGLQAGYWVAEFEFDDQVEAVEFMGIAHDHFKGTDDKDDTKLDVCMRLTEGE